MRKQEVEEAVVAGVITNYESVSQRFECTICERQGISELQAHLNSKDHKNSLIWEAVRNPNAPNYLVRLLPKVVRDAKSNSEVEVTNKATFSYKCLVCVDKKPFSGLTPLTSHFTGKEHTKAKKNRDLLNQLAAASGVGQFSSPPVLSSEHPPQLNRNRNSNSKLPQNSCYPSQLGALDRSQLNLTPEYSHQNSTPQYTQVPQPYMEGKVYQLYTSSHPTVPPHQQYSASLPTDISHQQHSASQPTVVPSSQPTPTTQRIHPTPTTQHSQPTVPSNQPTSTTQQSQDNFSNASYMAPNTMTSSSEHTSAHSHSVPCPTTSTNHNYAAPLSSTNHTYVVPPSSTNHNYAAPPSPTHNYATPTSSTDPCTPPSSVTMDMSIGADGSQMVSDFTGTEQLSADCKEVLRVGIVSRSGNGYYFSNTDNSTTPLSTPRVAPGPLSNLLKYHHHSTLHSTLLRHPRRRQRYATTPRLYATHDGASGTQALSPLLPTPTLPSPTCPHYSPLTPVSPPALSFPPETPVHNLHTALLSPLPAEYR
ncbi:hypothetical protein Pcinc_019091 [Petrolisthes cinctipes]|uniref:Uncharacterized protein n=1 Tax=Petrolisthes cinctipes TaxID=88211 RepID=A0AAE1FLK2_PETCI|nr:hypothetical protein Pcinc_019091 [Petrolisthes cinctipes]